MSSEIDQLYKICCVLGAPDWDTFPEATNISRLVDITYSDVSSSSHYMLLIILTPAYL